MSGPFQVRHSAVGATLGLRTSGETITHYPGGSGSGVSVTAIVHRLEPAVSDETGRSVTSQLQLEIPDSVTVASRDAWLVDAVRYQSVKNGLAHAGLRTVWVQRVDMESQREARKGVL